MGQKLVRLSITNLWSTITIMFLYYTDHNVVLKILKQILIIN